MLVILILKPLHHEIGYLELLILDWYYKFEKFSAGNSSTLVPHFEDTHMNQDQAPISKE